MKNLIYFMILLTSISYACGDSSIGDYFNKEKHKKYRDLYSLVGTKLPNIELEGIRNGRIQKIKFSRYKGSWVLLYFYPSDFTASYISELKDLSSYYKDFKKSGAELFAVSTDSVQVHKAWYEYNEDIKKIKFPILSDRSGELSRLFGTYARDKGFSHKAFFTIDPKGIIIAYEVYDQNIIKNAKDFLNSFKDVKAVERGVNRYTEDWEEEEFELTE